MKLEYKGHATLEQLDSLVDQATLDGAVTAIGHHLGIATQSVWYLLQNGWSQSLQDSYAGPRAKALKDGEAEDTVNAVIEACIAKRIESITKGTLEAKSTGGRDPMKAVARDMIAKIASAQGKPISKDNIEALLPGFIQKKEAEIKAEIARRKAAAKTEVSLDDLGV